MEDAAVQKLVSDQVAAAVAEAMKFNKAVKYLVTEDDGTQHLPYTDESGKPDHKLMGAAWAALHGGFRGKKYEGPDKQKAIERLKSVYEKEGMKPPEKMAAMALQMEDLRKRMADAIDKRTDSLRKDMSQVGRLADILQGIRWLQQSSFWEGQMEQDDRDFAIADRLGDWLQEGVNILNVIVMDETSELTASLEAPALKTAAIHNEGEVDMNATELLNKAAKGLKAHFGKAAAFHEHKAACHKAASTSHADLAEAHKAMMEFHSKTKKADGGDEEEKSFHKASHAFHKASHTHHVDKASHHEKLHKAHSTMCDACKAAAESVGNEEAKADGAGDMTKALGDTQAALEAKLEPITKALAALEKLESLTKAVETLQADVTKMGNETLPTLVKGAGSPQLIGRDGQNITPPAAGVDPGNLL